MAYLLDANVFISAKNLHYGFDFCPAFWDWLTEGHDAGAPAPPPLPVTGVTGRGPGPVNAGREG